MFNELYRASREESAIIALAKFCEVCVCNGHQTPCLMPADAERWPIKVEHGRKLSIAKHSFYCTTLLRIVAGWSMFKDMRAGYRAQLGQLVAAGNVWLPWEVTSVLDANDPLRKYRLVSNSRNKFVDRIKCQSGHRPNSRQQMRVVVIRMACFMRQLRCYLGANLDVLCRICTSHKFRDAALNIHDLAANYQRQSDWDFYRMDDKYRIRNTDFVVRILAPPDLLKLVKGAISTSGEVSHDAPLYEAATEGFLTLYRSLENIRLTPAMRCVVLANQALSAAYSTTYNVLTLAPSIQRFACAVGCYAHAAVAVLLDYNNKLIDDAKYRLYLRYSHAWVLLDRLTKLQETRNDDGDNTTPLIVEELPEAYITRGSFGADILPQFVGILPWINIKLASAFRKESFIKELVKCLPLRNQTRQLHERIAETFVCEPSSSNASTDDSPSTKKPSAEYVNEDFHVFFRALVMITLFGGYPFCQRRPRITAAYRLRKFLLALPFDRFRRLTLCMRHSVRFVLREYVVYLVGNSGHLLNGMHICAPVYSRYIIAVCDSFRAIVDQTDAAPLDVLCLVETAAHGHCNDYISSIVKQPAMSDIRRMRHPLVAVSKTSFQRYLFSVVYEAIQRIYCRIMLRCEAYARLEMLYSACLDAIQLISQLTGVTYTPADGCQIQADVDRIVDLYKDFVFRTTVLSNSRASEVVSLRTRAKLLDSLDNDTALDCCSRLASCSVAIEEERNKLKGCSDAPLAYDDKMKPLRTMAVIETDIQSTRARLVNGIEVYVPSDSDKSRVWAAILSERGISDPPIPGSLIQTLETYLSPRAMSGLTTIYFKYLNVTAWRNAIADIETNFTPTELAIIYFYLYASKLYRVQYVNLDPALATQIDRVIMEWRYNGQVSRADALPDSVYTTMFAVCCNSFRSYSSDGSVGINHVCFDNCTNRYQCNRRTRDPKDRSVYSRVRAAAIRRVAWSNNPTAVSVHPPFPIPYETPISMLTENDQRILARDMLQSVFQLQCEGAPVIELNLRGRAVYCWGNDNAPHCYSHCPYCGRMSMYNTYKAEHPSQACHLCQVESLHNIICYHCQRCGFDTLSKLRQVTQVNSSTMMTAPIYLCDACASEEKGANVLHVFNSRHPALRLDVIVQ